MGDIGLTSAHRRGARLAEALSLLPLAVAGAFVVTLVLNVRAITSALAWNSDFVSPMVLADGLGTAHGPKEVIFGTYAPLTTLWFNVVTRHFAGHRVLWKVAPLIFTVLGLLALGWAVWRVAGRWAAALTVAIGISGSTPVLTTLLAQASHGSTYVVTCLLGAFLVFLATRPVTPAVVAAAAVMGVVAGLNIASDPLLLLVGTGPFVGAAVLLFVRRRSAGLGPVAALAGAVTGLSLAVALVTTRVTEAAGYSVLGVTQGNATDLATPSQMGGNLRRLVTNLLDVFNADFGGRFGLTTPARALLAALAFGGLCVPVALLIRALATPRRPTLAGPDQPTTARVLLEAYWGLVVGGLVAGLVFSRVAVENASRSIGYLTPLFLAVAVAAPLVVHRSGRGRAVVGAGASLFCAFSLLSIVHRDIPKVYDSFSFVRDGNQVLGLLDQEGLHRGYASYGSAAPLTFRSGGRIRVLPVILCAAPAPAPAPAAGTDGLTLCGFPANRVRHWCTPQPGPSFVIADATLPWPVVAPPPAELGVPSRVLVAGSQTVYVYPYDVAERFGPTG